MSKDNKDLLEALQCFISGKEMDMSSLSTEEATMVEKLIQNQKDQGNYKKRFQDLQVRLEQLLDVLVEFAQFNFDMEIPISDHADELDGIALGLQTLGQEIEYYQKQLKLSNDNLVEAQSMANIGSWEIIVESNEMTWSDQMYTLYDMQPSGNETEEVTKLINKDDAEELGRLFDRAVNYHEAYKYTFVATVNGVERYIDAQAKPIFNAEGEVWKVVGTAMDITDRVIARRKLEKLNEDLEQKVIERTKDLEGFSYTVSHDLRAPLRSITGFSNILEEEFAAELPDEAKRLLQIIVNNASKMSTLIEELLTFSRVGVTVAKYDPLNLDAIVQNTWKEAIGNFTKPDDVQVEFGELPDVVGTQAMIHQVFVNLFSNALKYSSNEEKINIKIGVSNTFDGFVEVFVEDNGCGFDMKYHDKLFGVFQRLHSEDEFKGTGVGLALVKRIIDKHQGKIWAESEVDKGTKFFVRLPTEEPKTII